MAIQIAVASAVVSNGGVAASVNDSFVPRCLVEQCHVEAGALLGDDYAQVLANCAVDNFGPCGSKFWDCLGDSQCQAALSCVPTLVSKCSDKIWAMATDPNERAKVMCLNSCMKDGTIDPACALTKCGKAALDCLLDDVCRGAVNCIPGALLGCQRPAFDCIFGADQICHDNLRCFNQGLAQCAFPASNFLTDTSIADLIECAGTRCPHPEGSDTSVLASAGTPAATPASFERQPSSAPEQLLCVAEHCGSKVTKILSDKDSSDLLHCVSSSQLLQEECGSIWDCLGDGACNEALKCWAAPLENCSQDLWHAFTDAKQRQRIEHNAACLNRCQQAHDEDFVEATFCAMDSCSEDLVACSRDSVCRGAVSCLPQTLGACALPQLEAYTQQELFSNSTKCLGHSLEICGRTLMEMLRDQNVADAVRCAHQCTRSPGPSALIV